MFNLKNLVIYSCFIMIVLTKQMKFRRRRPLVNMRSKSALRVYKGVDDTEDKYPYVVSLGAPAWTIPYIKIKEKYEFIRTCSGSLITDEWVLTASHCVSEGRQPSPPLIRYGTTVKKNNTARYSRVLMAINHQAHGKFLGSSNDVGLLKVSKVSLGSYGRVSSVDYRALTGLPVTLIGYGLTALPPSEDDVIPYTLLNDPKYRKIGRAVVMPCPKDLTVQPVICLAGKCSPEENMLHTALWGDSGGPLLQGGQIVGVCQGAAADSSGIKVTFYTAVSPFLDWINVKMASANNQAVKDRLK